jgi:hypothetical protein
MPALESAPYLKPCPFCGCELESKWNRSNPSARCATTDCMGGKLPSLCLDVPEHIDAWNTRFSPTSQEVGEVYRVVDHKASKQDSISTTGASQ